MFTTRLRRAAVVGAALSAMAVTTASATAVASPTFNQQQVWFNCDGQQTKVVNANNAALGGQVPGWDTSAPTASVSGGAGCGQLDPAFLIATVEDTAVADGAWSGTFTGNLSSLTVELHSIYAGTARAGTKFGIIPRLYVDGQPLTFDKANLDVTPVRSSTGASEKITFSLTGLKLTEDLNKDGIPDPGSGTKQRKITLQVANRYIDGNAVGAWVWDTTEVPSGIVFNPPSAEPVGLVRQ